MKDDTPTPPTALPDPGQTHTHRLGEATFPSPLRLQPGRGFVSPDSRVLIPRTGEELDTILAAGGTIPAFETAGKRESIYFDPEHLKCGIVTCGGLCPGINNVIRSLVLTLNFSYGVSDVTGFRYGYQGLASAPCAPPKTLNTGVVEDIHRFGGSLLGSSRGAPPVSEIVDTLERMGIGILFAIGGDGTLRGVKAIAEEVLARDLKISIIGIPKTIDNDLQWVKRSFGFTTAIEEASMAIAGAHEEARGAWNGIGLVKLMGRNSGFIATRAALANQDVNFCLIPEVPFDLDGPKGFYAALEARLLEKHHAVVVVAEGAGQHLCSSDENGPPAADASGNPKLNDIGLLLKSGICAYLTQRGVEHTLKYIDPSYMVRSLPAGTFDSELCSTFAQYAVHAGMSGKTAAYIGYHNSGFIDVPVALGVGDPKQVNPESDLWRRVLESSGQPASMVNPAADCTTST